MATWLLKTEPGEYAFDDLQADGSTVWDGVSNNTALIHLRAMKKGDEAIIYHSGNQKRIAGLARITRSAYEDPANPGQTKDGAPKFAVVELKPLRPATRSITLCDLKADKRFAQFDLVRLPRLSVMPVPPNLESPLKALAGL
ncbi:MAG: EVE domain-containing protein [Phycisphaerales bacterium]